MKCLLLIFWFVALLIAESSAVAVSDSAVGKRNRVSLSSKSNQKKKRIKQKLEEAIQQPNDNNVPDDNSNSSPSPISVRAVLVPRTVSIQTMIRLVCIASMLVALLQCVKTAGIPHIKVIWDLVYNTANKKKEPMPSDYLPSSADLRLGGIIAKSTREILPPILLPSVGPLFGFLASTLLFLGLTVLLPRWFLPLRVFFDYETQDPCSLSSSSSSLSLTGQKVLVHIDDPNMRQDLASASDDGRRQSTVMCDLIESPPPKASSSGEKKSSKKKKGQQSNGSTLLLHQQYTHPYSHYFELNQCRYYFDASTGVCVDGGPMIEGAPLGDVRSLVTNGLSKVDRQVAKERFQPYNRPKLASATVLEAFTARISSPLVVVQLIGRLLSLLEDGIQSLLRTATSFGEHYMAARQAIISSRQMGQDVQASARDTSSLPVHVLQNRERNHWKATTAAELVPGDVFVLSPQEVDNKDEDLVIPVDALVLDGQGLANEAVLTGESVPQSKTPIDFEEELKMDESCRFDMNDHRSATLFAGTTLVHSSSDGSTARLKSYEIPPHNITGGLTCLALRTGTYSSKGQMLRALKTSTNVGAISNDQADKDALRLIISLSAFAVLSCLSLFLPSGDGEKPVPAFRRAIQCSRIAIASIPSDLPLALSGVAKSCSRQLRKESDVVCSEPGALLTAAYVDTVVFDKTGTITADTQSLSTLISDLDSSILETHPTFQKFILAGCHSLVQMTRSGSKQSGSTIVGDPLDMSALQYSDWKFNQTAGAYVSPKESSSSDSARATDPIKLWQIRSFPFDPSKRLSSALVLAESADHEFNLWILTKGSPETMVQLYDHGDDENDDSSFVPQFHNHTQQLEAQGYRCIALGAAKVSAETSLVSDLFPNGLCGDDKSVEYARAHGATLHRSDFENLRSMPTRGVSESAGLDFHGYACFDAKVRPSSKRVIQELQRGGIQPVMLTGDAIDAALAVGSKVGLVKERKVAILETIDTNTGPCLRWRFVLLKNGKASPSSRQSTNADAASVRDVIKRQKQGKLAMAATGDALELILDEQSSDKAINLLTNNLFRFSVLARATPALKTLVVTCLKDRCDKTVMMCGDGVNDVSAMKAADVAVALLNGFGAEGENEVDEDLDDKRRREKVKLMKIGSQRKNTGASVPNPRKQDKERVNAKIDEAHAEIRRKSAARQGVDPENVVLEIQDVKAMMSATMAVVKAESKRKQNLRKGGGDAARILAEERRKGSKGTDNTDKDDIVEAATIKPGEASLVAAFSCLHPSIDGVDAVLRSGIATAACALATQKTIALHSLLACYHLASLYRDGFRYGKRMWPVELTMYILIDQSRYGAACMARPRLPASKTLRPSISMFHSSVIGSTVGQAVIHLVTMAVGVNYARRLERVAKAKQAPSIRLGNEANTLPGKVEKLLGALVDGVAVDEEGETGIFRRPPFRPNYETNIVFILSILQSGVSSLLNHQGKPFYRSILETRPACVLFGATLVMTVVFIAENFRGINEQLQLRMLPSRTSRLAFLGIVTANVVGCFLCRLLADLSLEKPEKEKSVSSSRTKKNSRIAAEFEEELLAEEEKENMRDVVVPLSLFSIYCAFRGLSMAPAAPSR